MKAAALALAIATILWGCDTPQSMQVRSGTDPRFSDDDVRFRTTYYFTVLNVCYDADGNRVETEGFPEIDGVYRFVMTGKTDSLFNSIVFESGTLPAAVIDRFGQSVSAKAPGGLSPENSPDNDASKKSATDDGNCPGKARKGKGFRILGPEGVSDFDQDERLLMAMSTEARPLIGTLNKVAAITRQSRRGAGERLLPYLREESRSLEARLIAKDAPLDDVEAFGSVFSQIRTKLSPETALAPKENTGTGTSLSGVAESLDAAVSEEDLPELEVEE